MKNGRWRNGGEERREDRTRKEIINVYANSHLPNAQAYDSNGRKKRREEKKT